MVTGAGDARQLNRDRAADSRLEFAVRLWGPSVFRLALVRTGSRADAEDVYQDVFLQLATTKTAFNNNEHVKAWLLRATLNRCHDFERRAWRRKVCSFEELGIDFANEADESGRDLFDELGVTRQDLLSAVLRLSPKLRTVIHLRYGEELGLDEMARVLGCRPATVRTRLHRAHRKLRDLLGEG